MQFKIINTDESQRNYAQPSDALNAIKQEKSHGSRCYAVLTNDVLTVKFSTSFLRNLIDFLISYLHNPKNTFFSDRKITQCINSDQQRVNAARNRELIKPILTRETVISQLKDKKLKVYTYVDDLKDYDSGLDMPLSTKKHILELWPRNWARAEVCKLKISDQTEEWKEIDCIDFHTNLGDDRHREKFKLESNQLYRISFTMRIPDYEKIERREAYLVT